MNVSKSIDNFNNVNVTVDNLRENISTPSKINKTKLNQINVKTYLIHKTIDEIVRGSSLPLSIIIVGVGEADFSSMDILDADDEPLWSKKYKKFMASDIVQFVPFSEFKHDPRQLAKQTLEEVPGQFLRFMERNNIVPKQVHDAEKRKIRS